VLRGEIGSSSLGNTRISISTARAPHNLAATVVRMALAKVR
jgi:hypothetical protein